MKSSSFCSAEPQFVCMFWTEWLTLSAGSQAVSQAVRQADR